MRSHPVAWSLALRPDGAKQDPVVYHTEFGVVFLRRIHVLYPYKRASIASARIIQGLEEEREFRLVVELPYTIPFYRD